MAKKLYYEHKYYTRKDYEEEIVCENGVVASTSAAAMEADGGHSHPDSSLELDPEELNTSEAGLAKIPQRHRGHQNLFHFTRRQIRKMERVFKNPRTQIWLPETFAGDEFISKVRLPLRMKVNAKCEGGREELARALKVPEAKLKVWFANRRAKERRETLVLLGNTPPVEDIIILRDFKEDSS